MSQNRLSKLEQRVAALERGNKPRRTLAIVPVWTPQDREAAIAAERTRLEALRGRPFRPGEFGVIELIPLEPRG